MTITEVLDWWKRAQLRWPLSEVDLADLFLQFAKEHNIDDPRESKGSTIVPAQLYRSLERLHLAVIACARIGFEESSPITTALKMLGISFIVRICGTTLLRQFWTIRKGNNYGFCGVD
jgi:hypothetical protein